MPKMIPAVSPDLLLRAYLRVADDHKAGKDPDPDISVIAALHGLCSLEQMIATSHRLHALARLVDEQKGGGWTKDVAGKDFVLVNEALIRAAATAPLRRRKLMGELRFEPTEIQTIALRDAEPDGSA